MKKIIIEPSFRHRSQSQTLRAGETQANRYFDWMEILTNESRFVFADSKPIGGSALTPLPMGSWQSYLKSAIRDADELRLRLNLPKSGKNGEGTREIAAVQSFPVFVPLPFFERIRPGDPLDPLLKQVMPVAAEDQQVPGFVADPLGESAATKQPGLLQKYHGRALLITSGACAINCRYCFRRHFPYQQSPKSIAQWESVIAQMASDPTIEEVILSGGDPLMLVDEVLAALIAKLEEIPRLKRLRIHTRLPIMIPQRVTEPLLQMLSSTRLQTIMVLHSNHANELDEAVRVSLNELANGGTMLLNQSVLLAGVNDCVEVLTDLSQRLLDCRVLPYYLHKNDPIAGTAHFEVSVARGLELIAAMRTRLPGYAVPQFVQEVAGELSKTVL